MPKVIPAVDGLNELDDPVRDMKKVPDLDDDLRPYYELDYSKMKPNRFAAVKKVYKESTVPTKAARKSLRDAKK